MPEFHVQAGAPIKAPPEAVYAIFADYRVAHPAVLPRPPFTALDVIEGGQGAGTVIEVGMKTMGKESRLRGTVLEPEPGRVLAEHYDDLVVKVTTFTVDPLPDGTCHLTLATRGQTPHEGFLGRIEQILLGWLLRPIYRQEIALAAARAAGM